MVVVKISNFPQISQNLLRKYILSINLPEISLEEFTSLAQFTIKPGNI
jgi:hypothetical protein